MSKFSIKPIKLPMANVTGQAQRTERSRGGGEYEGMNQTSTLSQGGAFRGNTKNRLEIRSNTKEVPPSTKQSSRSRGEHSVQQQRERGVGAPKLGRERDNPDPGAKPIHFDKIRYPGYKELIYRK